VPAVAPQKIGFRSQRSQRRLGPHRALLGGLGACQRRPQFRLRQSRPRRLLIDEQQRRRAQHRHDRQRHQHRQQPSTKSAHALV
jgi:hypothetical protein